MYQRIWSTSFLLKHILWYQNLNFLSATITFLCDNHTTLYIRSEVNIQNSYHVWLGKRKQQVALQKYTAKVSVDGNILVTVSRSWNYASYHSITLFLWGTKVSFVSIINPLVFKVTDLNWSAVYFLTILFGLFIYFLIKRMGNDYWNNCVM